MNSSVPAFVPFGLQHWLGTGITVAIAVLLPVLVRWYASPPGQDAARRIIAVCLLIDIGLGLAVRVGVYGLPLLEHLPLHLCGMSVTLGAFMLWLRSYRLYQVLYYWGTGGVLVALLTPDVEQAFPHPIFFLFFLSHGLAFMAVMFATVVMGFRPRARSLLIVMPVTAAYALFMYPVNLVLGSNYLFLLAKPAQPSPLDFFGPWPWYLPGLVVMVAAALLLLYAPYAVFDMVRSRKKRGGIPVG